MRIGKLFALSMLTVTVFAVVLGAEVLVQQARIFTNRSDEISRQVQDSARVAGEAVQQAGRTNDYVGELAKAAGRIGDVVELISQIAGQTNLLGLNATIEAARGIQQVSASIVDVQRGASQTGSASSNVLASARSLSGESSRLKVEVGKFLDAIRAA
jgi:methyl-accepting chemotaxis protein